MIETLNGIYETVNCKQRTTLKLYDNTDYEPYPFHWHTAIEIIMPLDNSYYVNFLNQKVKLKEGDIMFICPGCVHGMDACDGRRIIFQPNTTYLRFMRDVEVLISVMSPYTVITPEEYPLIHEKLKEIMLNITNEYLANETFFEVSLYSSLLEMFSIIGKNHARLAEDTTAERSINQDEYVDKFLEVCDYINEHCSEDIKLDDIAKMSGFSKFYFERLFKQFTGTSLYKYVNQKRIAKAEQLLVEPGNSVTDVALNCGFSSMSSFIRMFKIIKGCTPTEFKNMYWHYEMRGVSDEQGV